MPPPLCDEEFADAEAKLEAFIQADLAYQECLLQGGGGPGGAPQAAPQQQPPETTNPVTVRYLRALHTGCVRMLMEIERRQRAAARKQ